MTPTSEKRRALFVISHNFGELGFAFDFSRDLDPYYEVCFTLPRHLYQINRNLSWPRCTEYRRDSEILKIYEEFEPDVVLFFSAFLLLPNHIFTLKSLKNFIEALNRDGRTIISSDPFLGITKSIGINDINLEYISTAKGPVRQFILKYLTCRQFRNVHAVLKNVHYLVPFGANRFDRALYLSYSNSTSEVRTRHSEQEPYWLFIISEFDYSIQHKKLGSMFIESLLDRISDANANDKIPMLLAPKSLISELSARMPSASICRSWCNVAEHEELVSNAERVFYWNMISHSLYHRLIYRRPFHFFDRGHVHWMFPGLHEIAIDHYFQNEEPDILDISKPLSLKDLSDSSDRFYTRMTPTLEKLDHLPRPWEVLKGLGVQ